MITGDFTDLKLPGNKGGQPRLKSQTSPVVFPHALKNTSRPRMEEADRRYREVDDLFRVLGEGTLQRHSNSCRIWEMAALIFRRSSFTFSDT